MSRYVVFALLLAVSGLASADPKRSAAPTPTKAQRASEISSLTKDAMAQKTPSQTGAVNRLITRVRAEKDPALHRMGVQTLLTQKLATDRPQKREILKMVRDNTRGLLPVKPPIPKQGTIEVRHYSMGGENFFENDMQALKKDGFTVTQRAGTVEATKGRIHVVMRNTHEDMLRDLSDSKVNMIVYNGHSQIGGTVEQSLLQANMGQPRGRKLVALFQCVGTQTLAKLKARAPQADVITSNAPLYVAETPHFVGALYQGIEKGENYRQLARRMDGVAFEKGRLVYPHQTATLKNTDFDMNGQLDANQSPAKIDRLSAADRRGAKALMSGVHYLGTMNPYYAQETPGAVYSADHAKIPLVAKGIVEGDGKSVTHITSRNEGGKRSYEVRLDSKFARAPREFIGAATVYETQNFLQKDLLGKSGPRENVRSLAFTGEYLDLMGRDTTRADKALKQVSARNGLPKLDLGVVRSALVGSHVLGESQVDRLEKVVKSKR